MKSNNNKKNAVDKDIQRLGCILPFFVVFLIVGPYFFVVPCIIIPRMSFSIAGVSHLFIASSLVILILTSYIKSIITPPGHIPPGWKPDLESGLEMTNYDNNNNNNNNDNNNNNEISPLQPTFRFCQKCNSHKPDRSHHCRVCDKCILKMDHHCPWINNCVGHDNHKYFLLFLIYACLGIFYALLLVVITFIETMHDPNGSEDFIAIFGLTILATILLPLGLAIVMLLVWQLWLVATNTTSIENEEFEKMKYTSRKEGKTYKHVNVYNLGTMTNLRSVFGPHILWWWYPTKCQGDGISYKRDYRSAGSVTRL